MGLCAVSDLVIAEAGARFGFTETRLGILPAVISPFVIAKIGETHARALFPGGRQFARTAPASGREDKEALGFDIEAHAASARAPGGEPMERDCADAQAAACDSRGRVTQ